MEETAVMAIYHMSSNKHVIRSAFTRGSIRGHIYVECEMDHTVQQLLLRLPGVRLIQGGIRAKLISPKDHTKLLTMKNVSGGVEIHSWVRVREGLYKGDEGLVITVHDWGVVVLLVPRIGDINTTKKRKATMVRPAPRLFEADAPSHTVGQRGINGSADSIGREIRTENGLILKAYDFASVIQNVSDIPFQIFQEFARSEHPIFQHVKLIRPREWQFDIKDAIFNTATAEDGVVETVQHEGVEATMSTGLLVFVPWKSLRKSMRIGERITIMAGARTGTSGWVVAVRGNIATVAIRTGEGNIQGVEEDIEVWRSDI